MAYNPQTNLFNPQVAPDTGAGLARGILSFGQSIGDALSQYGMSKHKDAQRLEDRGWQVQDQQAMWDNQATVRGDAKAEREAERQQKQQAEANAADATLAASLIAYGSALPPEMVQLAQHAATPEAKKSYGDMIAQYGADQLKQQQAQEAMARGGVPRGVPITTETGATMGHAIVDNNGKVYGWKPAESQQPQTLQQTHGPNGEVIYNYGDSIVNPQNIYRPAPGPYAPGQAPLVPLVPPQQAPVRGVPMRKPDGTSILVNPYTGQPLNAAPTASAAPAPTRTAQSYYQ